MATNRGKYFEEWIELANATYNAKGQAVITKIPTPWTVQRKYNPYTTQYEIATAFPKQSTVDFGGTAYTYSIWFDAKVTKNKTSFPLMNIHKHQIEYLKRVYQHGGKAFLLIHSEHLKKTWLLWIKDLMEFINNQTRKSIPFTWFDENCSLIEQRNGIILDYLPHVLQ